MARGDYVPPGKLLQVPVEHELEGERMQVVSAEFMEKARAAGLGVQVWTVNDPEEMRWLAVEMKVAGIMTDDPGLLQEVISELGGA
jgi:glycerophosphoryl diester phosphodiesterase